METYVFKFGEINFAKDIRLKPSKYHIIEEFKESL